MDRQSITAVILAGGRGRRAGGADKGLISWREKPLIEHAIAAIEPQVDQIMLSCNRNIETYQTYGFAVVADQLDNFQGPLSGIMSVIDSGRCQSPLLLLCPCDCPNPPSDLAYTLLDKLNQDKLDCVYCHDGERDQYLLALLSTACGDSLRNYLESGNRSVKAWFKQLKSAAVDFSDREQHCLNFNLGSELTNSPPD